MPVHNAGALTYRKLSWLRLGLPVNFSVRLIENGTQGVIQSCRAGRECLQDGYCEGSESIP